MSVKIGSARISENGTSGWDGKAKAGDQTGREVSTQDWYLHPKKWIVLRPKNRAVAELIARNMQYACDNKNIGYDQSQRYTLYDVAKKVGFDCSKVTTKCETDCSALVRVCVNYAGVECGNFRTANEVDVLMSTGAFRKLTAKKYTETSDYLEIGDVLVTAESGHTVVCLSNGAKVEAEPEKKAVRANRGAESFSKAIAGKYETTGNLNMRQGAGTSYGVMTVIPKGKEVRCYGFYTKAQRKDWYYVETVLDGVTYIGFCSSVYLRRV